VRWKPKDNAVSPTFLDHMLAINDVRVIADCLPRHSAWRLTEWLDDSNFRQGDYQNKVPFRYQKAGVRYHYPDAYFTLESVDEEKTAHFFLEQDQGKMSHARWREKIRAYTTFRESGTAFKHYKTKQFRMLTVTKSQPRVRTLVQTTEQAGGNHYFWFTSKDKVSIWQPHKLLEPIWSVCTKDDIQALF